MSSFQKRHAQAAQVALKATVSVRCYSSIPDLATEEEGIFAALKVQVVDSLLFPSQEPDSSRRYEGRDARGRPLESDRHERRHRREEDSRAHKRHDRDEVDR